MCDYCGKEWIPLGDRYPCGPCPDEWICSNCGKRVSPCCGAKIIELECSNYCEVCNYCGNDTCSKCNQHCHCGGCV